ncbi:MAG: biotin/lipoyl attachment protein [Firmicutes bacterium]|nr:biotin/lipoyl attachment protein [Bacillota bacterium]
MDLTITINGTSYSVEVEKTGGSIAPSAPTAAVAAPAAATPVAPPPKAAPAAAPVPVSAGDTTIKAPMPGKVNKVNIKVGDKVAKGDILMFLEAMKMQNEIAASVDGVIKVVNVSNDENVKPGQVLAVIGN